MSPRPMKPRPQSDAVDNASPTPLSNGRRHLAMRLDDAWLGFQTRLAIRRGRVETVIPYTGYGST
ncbi:MAG: ACP synthase, partial [Paenarthrobacter sp.]